MTKNKIFIAVGTLVLAIAGFLTSKANSKKFATATSAYFYTDNGSIATVFAGVSGYNIWNLTTSLTCNCTAYIKCSFTYKRWFAIKVGSTLTTTLHYKCP